MNQFRSIGKLLACGLLVSTTSLAGCCSLNELNRQMSELNGNLEKLTGSTEQMMSQTKRIDVDEINHFFVAATHALNGICLTTEELTGEQGICLDEDSTDQRPGRTVTWQQETTTGEGTLRSMREDFMIITRMIKKLDGALFTSADSSPAGTRTTPPRCPEGFKNLKSWKQRIRKPTQKTRNPSLLVENIGAAATIIGFRAGLVPNQWLFERKFFDEVSANEPIFRHITKAALSQLYPPEKSPFTLLVEDIAAAATIIGFRARLVPNQWLFERKFFDEISANEPIFRHITKAALSQRYPPEEDAKSPSTMSSSCKRGNDIRRKARENSLSDNDRASERWRKWLCRGVINPVDHERYCRNRAFDCSEEATAPRIPPNAFREAYRSQKIRCSLSKIITEVPVPSRTSLSPSKQHNDNVSKTETSNNNGKSESKEATASCPAQPYEEAISGATPAILSKLVFKVAAKNDLRTDGEKIRFHRIVGSLRLAFQGESATDEHDIGETIDFYLVPDRCEFRPTEFLRDVINGPGLQFHIAYSFGAGRKRKTAVTNSEEVQHTCYCVPEEFQFPAERESETVSPVSLTPITAAPFWDQSGELQFEIYLPFGENASGCIIMDTADALVTFSKSECPRQHIPDV